LGLHYWGCHANYGGTAAEKANNGRGKSHETGNCGLFKMEERRAKSGGEGNFSGGFTQSTELKMAKNLQRKQSCRSEKKVRLGEKGGGRRKVKPPMRVDTRSEEKPAKSGRAPCQAQASPSKTGGKERGRQLDAKGNLIRTGQKGKKTNQSQKGGARPLKKREGRPATPRLRRDG